ncbi:MAG TPA: CapA family protein [Kineosporiaceae bacterium]
MGNGVGVRSSTGVPALRRTGRGGRRAASLLCGLVAACSGLVAACGATPASPRSPLPGHAARSAPRSATLEPASASAAASAGAAGNAGSFSLLAAGDVLVHDAVLARARSDAGGAGYDFGAMLARIAPRIAAADVAICHLETPLSATDTHLSGYPVFNTPRELATALAAAGFDGCSTASNHALDQGLPGVTSTLDVLDAAHLSHAGTARSAAERHHVDTYLVHGVRVAHLSYTYGTNGVRLPVGAAWAVNRIDVPTILADARAARAEGAGFVVVSMHWGLEYHVEPTPEQQEQARRLLASPDIDLILGDHVHVQQPVERVGDKYVVYGLGNLLSNQSPASGLPAQTEDGALVTVHVQGVAGGAGAGLRHRVDQVTYTPTFCPIGSYQVVPVVSALADPATPDALRAALRASLARTRAIQDQGVATLAG